MAYGLRNRGTPKDEIDSRVAKAADDARAPPLLDRRPRAALRRPAPARRHGPCHRAQPGGLPVRRAALQSRRQAPRARCGSRSRTCNARVGTTTVYVTHDQLEAMTLADILVVMNAGLVEQMGAPLDIYEKPASTFVAGFIGAPPMNILPATVAEGGLTLAGGQAVPLAGPLPPAGTAGPLRHSPRAPRPRRRGSRDRGPRGRDPRRRRLRPRGRPASASPSSSACPATRRPPPAVPSPSAPRPASPTSSTPRPAAASRPDRRGGRRPRARVGGRGARGRRPAGPRARRPPGETSATPRTPVPDSGDSRSFPVR